MRKIEKRKMNKKEIKKSLLAGVTVMSLALSTISNPLITEAKRNRKPTITFKGKLKNNKKVTINEGERILVKATAKDKEDGNITKKVKVKVNKPEDGEIQKEGNYIRFINDGTYKVTVSVKDSKKKTASLTRTVVVKEDESLTTQTPVVTSNPVPIQTAKPTQTPVATNKPTEELHETMEPLTTTSPTILSEPTDYSKYDIKNITVDNNNYNITNDSNFWEIISKSNNDSDIIKISIENDYTDLMTSRDSSLYENSEYLKYYGKITATSNGRDISDKIVIYDFTKTYYNNESIKRTSIFIYVEDDKGNNLGLVSHIYFKEYDNNVTYDENSFSDLGWSLVSYEPLIYGIYRNVELLNSTKLKKMKK